MKTFIPDKLEPLDSDDSSIGDDFVGVLNQHNGVDDDELSNLEDDDLSDLEDDDLDTSNLDSELSSDDDSEASNSNGSNKDLDLKPGNKETRSNVADENNVDQADNLRVPETKEREDNDDAESNDNDDDDDDCDSTSSEEIEATMQDIFGTKPNQEANRKHPPNVKTETSVLDICFHPEVDLFATAAIDGECVIYRYSLDKVEEVTKLEHHKKSCRQICFSADGDVVYTVSKDKSIAIIDSSNSAIKSHIKGAHDSPIYSFFELDDNVIATGDDDGTVKLWDLRKDGSVLDFKCGEETVTSLLSCEKTRFLSATVADGSLTGYHIRKKRIEAQSEMFSSEFTCQSFVNNEARLCVGSGQGMFYIFNWGEFGCNVDAMSGHPGVIQCQVPISDKILITGCEDGNIRAVHLYPHRFIGVVGQHKDFGIENLAVSNDGNLLASCSMGDEIQFWNIKYLYDIKQGRKMSKKRASMINLSTSRKRNPKEFFRDVNAVLESDDECGPVPSTSYADSD